MLLYFEVPMKPLSILIADDHAVVRRGMRALLETQPNWQVCGEAQNGREALEEARRLKPDLAVLDITMPELNGLEAIARIREEVPQTRVLVLTMHDDKELIQATVKAGAHGYLLKSDSERDLITAVDALAHDKAFFTQAASETVRNDFRGAHSGTASHRRGGLLTKRERQVLQLLAEGRSNKEVAGRLGISTRTAENHRANIMRKLACRSIADLIRYAIRKRMVQV
jgi:DNA-binding NarL/FixJ family response regulator